MRRKHFLKVDIKRALTEPAFIACTAVGCVLAFLSFGIAAVRAGADLFGLFTQSAAAGQESSAAGGLSSAAAWFRASQPILLPFAAPFLAAAPYCTMSMLEEETGYGILMKEKLKRGGYELGRFLSNGIAGGLTLLIPVTVLGCLCMAAGAAGYGFGSAGETGPVLGSLGMDFLFGFCFASLSYGLSFLTRKRYLPIVMPQVFYLLFIYAFPLLGLSDYFPPLLYSPWALGSSGTTGTSELKKLALSYFVLLIVGLILTAFGRAKRTIKEADTL